MEPKSLRFLVLISLLLTFFVAIADADPEVKLSKPDLERLTGSYANVEMGFAFQLDLQGERLKLTMTEGPRFENVRLLPTSPVRFRMEGEGLAPGLAMTFQLPEGGGKAESLTVIQPRMPVVVMKRVN
jgi:hypothetical protein